MALTLITEFHTVEADPVTGGFTLTFVNTYAHPPAVVAVASGSVSNINIFNGLVTTTQAVLSSSAPFSGNIGISVMGIS